MVTKVKTDMNATENFFEVITASHIVAVTLRICGMTSLEDTPHNPPFDVNIDELSPHQKWLLLSTFIQGILSTTWSQPWRLKTCKGKLKREKGIQTTCESMLVWYCLQLFLAEFKDAVREGDGIRVDRVWKYLLLFFRSSGKTKYVLEACNFRNSLCHLAFRSSCCGQDL